VLYVTRNHVQQLFLNVLKKCLLRPQFSVERWKMDGWKTFLETQWCKHDFVLKTATKTTAF